MGEVLDYEKNLRKYLVQSQSVVLRDKLKSSKDADNLKEALKISSGIFQPFIWRWKNDHQVEIKINSESTEVIIKGRNSQIKEITAELLDRLGFIHWLSLCTVWHNPLEIVSPQVLKNRDFEIEKRIARVTDPDRDYLDIWEQTQGTKATRESRMETVAWICVCLFDCTLEGGFVRDWIVGGDALKSRPPNLKPKEWFNGYKLEALVAPADIDVQLPVNKLFDLQKFLLKLAKYHITARVLPRQAFKHTLLLDEDRDTGPFMVEMIEPHIVGFHDKIDFDVSNLCCRKEYTRELGMRIDVTPAPYNITLDNTVLNIKNKKFITLNAEDSYMRERIKKMKDRGWTPATNENLVFVPSKGMHGSSTLINVPKSDPQYNHINSIFASMFSSATIVSIEQIRCPSLDLLYEAMKNSVAKENDGEANEKGLFHGTREDSVKGIQDSGFDDRYFSKSGNFGSGAYFADNPRKSDQYTNREATATQRYMFYCKVLLGKVQDLQRATCATRKSCDRGYHSVFGITDYNEYIVYRYGQSKPFLKITYTV
eukprot:TRINITY_DN9350_c0_g2_i1.p1 TRINITY_DN9350_c0_g2~~TRINITY_DN9350_c0_g2_i1.p1  ORF type:complete len:540 (+),score=95.22 TRINITY_DN9350_c0_g2_i1:577-2196(+)